MISAKGDYLRAACADNRFAVFERSNNPRTENGSPASKGISRPQFALRQFVSGWTNEGIMQQRLTRTGWAPVRRRVFEFIAPVWVTGAS